MAAQILITMDDLETAVPLNAALESAGFSTAMFSSLDDARGSVRRENPDLVILTGTVHDTARPHPRRPRPRLGDLDPRPARAHRLRARRAGRPARRHRDDDEARAAGGGGRDRAAAARAAPAPAAHRHHRREPGDPGGAGQDRADGAGVEHGADPGRERHRQGAGRQGDPRPLAPAGPALHHGQLRRAPRDAAGVGAVRAREGRLHRRRRAAAGPVRAGRHRDHLPRRDRRDPAVHPGEAAPGAGEPDVLPGGGRPADQGGRPGHRRDQPRIAGGGGNRRFPGRPLLPAQRPQHLPRPAAGAAGGHPDPGPAVHPGVRPGPGPHLPGDRARRRCSGW